MYKCKKCKKQSLIKQSQFKLITEKRKLIKGFDIAKEINVCEDCYKRNK